MITTRDAKPPENAICLTNAQPDDLLVWLEPWVDEIVVPRHAELALYVEGAAEALPDLEFTNNCLVIWGVGGSRIRVRVDGVELDTYSRLEPAPPVLGGIGTKGTVDMFFGAFPEMRPGGSPLPGPVPPGRGFLATFLSRLRGRN